MRNSLVRWGNTTLVFGIILSTAGGALLLSPEPARAETSSASSAVTVSWADTHAGSTSPNAARFEDLAVTVSQTENLVNQGVTITWSGAKPTSAGAYANNYLQVMQCWGDDPAGPSPKQCQFGAVASNVATLMGNNASSRTLVRGEDPAQAYSSDLRIPPPPTNPNLRAYAFPFESVKGTSGFDVREFFTSATTNEIAAARTGGDGTGVAAFELQTALEAPDLGCGATIASTGATRNCWLVVVPRGDYNADGTAAVDNSDQRVAGSPFTATNWADRIVVPMKFQSVAISCPIGNAEARVVGSEMVGAAFTSWQPALCKLGTTYGFSQVGDGEARRQIVSSFDGASRLAFVSDPLDSATAGDATIVYAPAAQSAVVIAFNIDYQLRSDAQNFSKNGTQVESLKLNARLVAKMLTQSYGADVPGLGLADPVIKNNPRSIAVDPEFRELNPSFTGFVNSTGPEGLMVALGSSDANALVWQWLRSDPQAKAFLAGSADEWGMKVNSAYLALALATTESTDSFPKADLTTYRASGDVPEPGYGTLDLRPYMNDMGEAALRARRADANARTQWDPTRTPPAFVATGAQVPGSRFALAITDLADAKRYGLTSARLVNAAGEAVAPTSAAITTAISAMVDSDVPGVKRVDPAARTLGAYPLSTLTYAAVNVCEASKAELSSYVRLLKYATGDGQVVGESAGQLPAGYVPLVKTQVTQSQKAIATLTSASKGGKPCAKAPSAPASDGDSTDDGAIEPAPPVDSGTPTTTPTSDPEETEVRATRDSALPLGRLGTIAALGMGLPALVVGPILARRGRRMARLGDLPE